MDFATEMEHLNFLYNTCEISEAEYQYRVNELNQKYEEPDPEYDADHFDRYEDYENFSY